MTTPTPPAATTANTRALFAGVVVLLGAMGAIATVYITRPDSAGGASSVILALAVPAIGALFLAAKISYTASALTESAAQHTAVLSVVQGQLNGTLDGRIRDAVRAVMAEVGQIVAHAPATAPTVVVQQAAPAPLPATPTDAPSTPLM